jgi:hypothetical protein
MSAKNLIGRLAIAIVASLILIAMPVKLSEHVYLLAYAECSKKVISTN